MTLEPRPYGWLARFAAMASPCEIHLADCERARAEHAVAAVVAEAARIESKFSRYIEGNIVDRINSADGEPVEVDPETASLLNYAQALYAMSDGSFDVTSGILRRAWRFDGSDRLPRAGAVRRLLRRVGWHRVRWESPWLRLEPGMEIDFGGIGKEYAVDRCGAAVAAHCPRALLNFGGDLLATGVGVDRGGWTVGVEGLCGGDIPVRRISLTRGGIATSGDSRRFLLRNGRRYGHILDPRTGWPVEGAPRSVTVLAPTCTEAGMLATMAMLAGSGAEAFLEAQGVRHWCQR